MMDFDTWFENQTLQTRFVWNTVMGLFVILIIGLGIIPIIDVLGFLIGFAPPETVSAVAHPEILNVVTSSCVLFWSVIILYLVIMNLDEYLLKKVIEQ